MSAPRLYHTSDFMKFKKQIPPKLAKLESPWSLAFPLAIPWKMLKLMLPTHPSDCLHTPQGLTAAEGLEQSWLERDVSSGCCSRGSGVAGWSIGSVPQTPGHGVQEAPSWWQSSCWGRAALHPLCDSQPG